MQSAAKQLARFVAYLVMQSAAKHLAHFVAYLVMQSAAKHLAHFVAYLVMQSAAKHLAWRGNSLRLQTLAREMLRCALHDLILLSNCYLIHVYMLTNNIRTVLYTGVTNNLARRLAEHSDTLGQRNKFTGRYQANLLVYFEICADPTQAIAREKEIKGWSRAKKETLIATFNPTWEAIDLETWTGTPGLH